MDKMHMKEVGTSYAPCFLLLKLHYLLQCKTYPESGEEFNNKASASCFVCGFFLFVARAC